MSEHMYGEEVPFQTIIHVPDTIRVGMIIEGDHGLRWEVTVIKSVEFKTRKVMKLEGICKEILPKGGE